jgi:hypothetical protein
MAANDKDTIYIDIDDEITGVIDKVQNADGKIVALVLPKRAAVFQSIVNMKLLKRSADSSKKHLVLITSEAGLLPLAGAAGIHVAKTLNSKPEIPVGPDTGPSEAEEEPIQEDPDEPVDSSKSVGQLAGAGAAGVAAADGMETLTLDDEDLPPEALEEPAKKGAKTFEPPKGKKNKKLAIPNFERFRLWLILGGLLLLLIIGGFAFASFSLPKATISIKTDATKVDANVGLNLSTDAKTVSTSTGTVPAKVTQVQKTYTSQVPTTGQKNNGNKASGTVTLTNCSETDDVTVPAGTGLSSGGNTYISQSTVNVPASSFRKGSCQRDQHVNVDIIAQSPGSSYNGATSFTVAGYSTVTGAAAGNISGGTDSIVQIVNQNDVTSAKSKIKADETNIRNTLENQLKKDGLYPVEATYSTGTPSDSFSANVGDVANNLTLTETVTYTMFGAKESDLQTLIADSVKDRIDTSKQSIIDDGLDKATYNVDSLTPTLAKLTLSTTATAGPDLNTDDIKAAAAGKKPGPVRDELKNNPDVTDVDIKLSPFWVGTIPKKTDRITVNIAEPTNTTKASSDGNNP